MVLLEQCFMTLSRSNLKQQIHMPCAGAIKLSFDCALRVFGRLMQIEKNYTVFCVKHQMELSAHLEKFVTVWGKENSHFARIVLRCMFLNEI